MRQINLILVFLLLCCFTVFGQSKEKIFYNENWKVCKKSNAEYYRVITFDGNGKPLGMVKDYYITGELQWEGFLSYVDKYDNAKDIAEGQCTWYHKNGNKSRESVMVNNLENGRTTFWHENGIKAREFDVVMGVFDGVWIEYYATGKIFRKFNFTKGKINNNFIECDEFGKCQRVFSESFLSEENPNEWRLITDDKEYKSSIIPEKGLLMETKTEYGFRQTINIPLSLTENFSIETIIDFKSGSKNSGHGLIWGFKDWDNYYFFYISANGYYRIGAKTEGINIEFVEWTQSKVINQDFNRNQIKILRVDDKMYFSINGSIVHSESFYSFRGNNIGFSISSGKKSVLFEDLIVKQDIEDNIITDNEPNLKNGEWAGNGSGLIISKSGYIVTNHHVIEGAEDIEVEFTINGEVKMFNAEIVQSDKVNDLAIIKILDMNFDGLDEIQYNFKSRSSDVGTKVYAYGYPMALSLMGKEIKVTDGIINSKTGLDGDITTYQISATIQPGNSGGPLFDDKGSLIGINSSGLARLGSETTSYSIKTSYVLNLIDVLPKSIDVPSSTKLESLPLTEQIKEISKYVVLVKVK